MMKTRAARLSFVAALVLVSATAAAQRMFADFAGMWNVTIQGPSGAMNSTLNLKQKGDTITGETESELGKAAIQGLARGDTLRFVFSLDMQGQQINVQASAVLKDKDTMNGNFEVVGMGGFPFEATRKKE